MQNFKRHTSPDTSRVLLRTGNTNVGNPPTSGRNLEQDPHLDVNPSKVSLSEHASLSIPAIHRVPLELIGEIFLYYIHIEYDLPPFIHDKPHLSVGRGYWGTPVTLSHVCGYWRMVVEAMPTLWQSLSVCKPKPRHIPIIKFWLKRSGDCLLDLHMWASDKTDIDEAGSAVMSLFVECVHRWRSVNFVLWGAPYRALATLQPGLAKNLQHASMKMWQSDPETVDSIWRALHSSPVLSYLDWGVSYETRELPNHTPWEQLMHLRIPHQPTDSVLNSVQFCYNLRVLDIDYLSGSKYQNPLPMVALPYLHTLIILAHKDPSTLFKHLVLPSLVSLKTNYYCNLSPTVSQSLSELFHRSSCHLKELEFHGSAPYVLETELHTYLSSPYLQDLVKLHLATLSTDSTVGLLNCSNSSGKTPTFLPNLRILTLGRCETTDGTLADMVASRVTRLRDVRFVYGRSNHDFPLDHARLQKMRNDGLQIQLQLN